MIFRSIIDRSEIGLLVSRSAKREASAHWVAGLLERNESRLHWCRMALSDGGELLAAHAMDSWSFDQDPGDTPTFVTLLGHADEEAAVALLTFDLSAFGAATVDARLVSDADAPAQLSMQREGQQRVLGTGVVMQHSYQRPPWCATTGAARLLLKPCMSTVTTAMTPWSRGFKVVRARVGPRA